MPYFKLFSDNWIFENNLSAEEVNLLKPLMRNKNIIQKGNIVIINDNEKYTEGVKSAISDANKFVQLNTLPDKSLNDR